MSLKRKLSGEVEISASAGDAHHDIYKSKPHHVSHAAPHFVQACDLHEGELGQVGSIVIWNYTLGGKPMIAKTKISEIDEEKKLVSYTVLEGDLLVDYNSFIVTNKITPKDNHTSIVSWVFEYEKKHPGIPEPTALLDAKLGVSTDIHDHHHAKK